MSWRRISLLRASMLTSTRSMPSGSAQAAGVGSWITLPHRTWNTMSLPRKKWKHIGSGLALHVPVAQVEEIFPEANAVALPFDVDFGARILEAGQERQRNGSNSQMKYLVVFPCINSHCSDISMHPLSSLRCTPISLPSCHAPHRADLYEKMSSKESSVCSHQTALVRREIKNK